MADNLQAVDHARSCSEPMFELLLSTSATYFVVGAIGEALILIGSAVTTGAIAIVQGNRTERVPEALLASPRRRVD